MKIFNANLWVLREFYFVLIKLLLSYDQLCKISVIVMADSGRNFVGFNSAITTSSEHVTNVSFLVVTNL